MRTQDREGPQGNGGSGIGKGASDEGARKADEEMKGRVLGFLAIKLETHPADWWTSGQIADELGVGRLHRTVLGRALGALGETKKIERDAGSRVPRYRGINSKP